MSRRVKLVALVLVPAVLLASLSSLASNRASKPLESAAARGMTDQLSKQQTERVLLPVALEQAEKSGQGGLSKEARNRLLEELQTRLGVYRPWAKAPSNSNDSLRLDRRAQ